MHKKTVPKFLSIFAILAFFVVACGQAANNPTGNTAPIAPQPSSWSIPATSGGPAIQNPMTLPSLIKESEQTVVIAKAKPATTIDLDKLTKDIGPNPILGQVIDQKKLAESALADTTANLATTIEKAKQVEQQLQIANVNVLRTENALEAFKQQVNKNETTYSLRISELTTANEQANARLQTVQANVATISKDLQEALDKWKLADLRATQLEANLATALQRIATMETDIEKQKVVNTALQQMVVSLQNQINTQAQAQASDRARITALENALAQATAQAVVQAPVQVPAKAQNQTNTQATTQTRTQQQAQTTPAAGGDKGPAAVPTATVAAAAPAPTGGTTTQVVQPTSYCRVNNADAKEQEKKQSLQWRAPRLYMDDRVAGDLKEKGGRCETHFGVPQTIWLWSVAGTITADGASVPTGNEMKLPKKVLRLVIEYQPGDSTDFQVIIGETLPVYTETDTPRLPVAASGNSAWGYCQVQVAGSNPATYETKQHQFLAAPDRFWMEQSVVKAIQDKGGKCLLNFGVKREFAIGATEGDPVTRDGTVVRLRDAGREWNAQEITLTWVGPNKSAGFDVNALPGPDFVFTAAPKG